jgi:hypothetical protein
MRRSTVLTLLGIVLVVAFGAYTAFWWIAAGKIADAATAWRDSVRAQKIDASWETMRVAGYPFSFRLELAGAALKNEASLPAAELQAPALDASIRPWNFHAVWLDAPDGLSTALGPAGIPFARISAEHGSGAAAIGDNGRITIWLSLRDAKGELAVPLSARSLDAWAILPGGTPATHQDAGMAFAASLRGLAVPVAPPGLKDTIDEIGFGVTLMGAFPPGPLAQAAAKWRDAGGSLDLDHLDLRWGDIRVAGSGTLALDNTLQPVGSLSGGVAGFDPLLTALVAAGRIKAGDARMARLALALLAKPGPDGRPEITSSLSIQDGQMYLGPAKLGPAPRIDW